MVLVPIHCVTRRLLGLFGVALCLVAFVLFLGQVHHLYQQHLKFRRLESYSRYVDDVTNDLVKLENLANKSSLSVDQFLIMLGGQQPMQTKRSETVTNSTYNTVHDQTIR
ncbi:hypothetical protein ONE63_008001 [Megalurothrips usitatus]|uniref:Uncharacterized protein n=1 Tax=Megalurothrips usitatus TaxID=439358 RepID=A0AAV7XX19_9NEOP|nr:hypothetical protein ONE63_008001 [Megalurothrips usitatus]